VTAVHRESLDGVFHEALPVSGGSEPVEYRI
jgi:hypothetical protein